MASDLQYINLQIPYVSTYATLSHLYDDGLTNQRQFRMKQVIVEIWKCRVGCCVRYTTSFDIL